MKALKSLMKNRKFKIAAVAVPLVVLFIFCSAGIVSQYADISRLKKQEADYSAQLAEQEEENQALEEILDSEDKDEYIEQKAREKGYVKSDEIVFYDIAGSN